MERTAEHPGSEISADVLSEKLTKYWELHERKEGLARRLDRAAAEKETVSEKIYERVVADYRRESESVETTLDPLRVEIDRLRGMCENRRDEVRRTIADLEDQLAEADFRQRVGEYTDSEVSGVHDDVNPRLVGEQQQLSEINSQIEAFEHPPTSIRHQHVEPVAPTHRIPDAAATPAAAPTSHPMAPSVDPAPADATLVDTQYGFAQSRVDPQHTDEDPLAALADPSPSLPDPSHAGEIHRITLTSGPNRGNVTPLSQAPMSVGREHDNTIELKDSEVARYHARIVYSNGSYYIEDLESSTGTWVNGMRRQRTVLNGGDIVRVGTTEFRFE